MIKNKKILINILLFITIIFLIINFSNRGKLILSENQNSLALNMRQTLVLKDDSSLWIYYHTDYPTNKKLMDNIKSISNSMIIDNNNDLWKIIDINKDVVFDEPLKIAKNVEFVTENNLYNDSSMIIKNDKSLWIKSPNIFFEQQDNSNKNEYVYVMDNVKKAEFDVNLNQVFIIKTDNSLWFSGFLPFSFDEFYPNLRNTNGDIYETLKPIKLLENIKDVAVVSDKGIFVVKTDDNLYGFGSILWDYESATDYGAVIQGEKYMSNKFDVKIMEDVKSIKSDEGLFILKNDKSLWIMARPHTYNIFAKEYYINEPIQIFKGVKSFAIERNNLLILTDSDELFSTRGSCELNSVIPVEEEKLYFGNTFYKINF